MLAFIIFAVVVLVIALAGFVPLVVRRRRHRDEPVAFMESKRTRSQ